MLSKLDDPELSRFQVFCWQIASKNKVSKITPSVMAGALLISGPNSVTKVLNAMEIDLNGLKDEVVKHFESSLPKRRSKQTLDTNVVVLSESSKDIMKIANCLRELMSDPAVGTQHVLLAILKHEKDLSILFEKYCVTSENFRKMVKSILLFDNAGIQNDCGKNKTSKTPHHKSETNKPEPESASDLDTKSSTVNEKEILTKYCRNLTALATQKKLDPVIGREKEIARLITTLGRRKKNNAILVGEPGVGKTAIVEGLAQRIALGAVPQCVKTCKVFQLNISAVVGKTTYRGQFEERMRMILELFGSNKNYILFIDEMHTLIGAGGSAGGLDAANIMKPALAGGEVRCIGATTEDEYRKYFKKDGALERRFQRIFVEEPSKEEAIQILMGIRPVIEAHHNCTIPDDTIKSAVELSIRHVTDRYLPDKAIDCLDEACANAVVREENNGKKIVVQKIDIVGSIAVQTDMPAEIVGVSDINKAKNLFGYLKNSVVGQDQAIHKISNALLSSYAGIRNPTRPIGCFVFGGSSGSGTTFVAEKMADGLFSSDSSFIRIDMSDASEKFGNTKLIGSPPGYIGYGEKNQLTDKVSRKQYCLVLFDGIENANDEVIKLITHAMSKGSITDASGHEVSFKNAIIVMTFNCKTASKLSGFGFSNTSLNDDVEKRENLITECCDRFGDDFVNKIDEFIVFKDLNKEDIKRITLIRMDNLSTKLKDIGIVLSYYDAVVDLIVENASSKNSCPTIKEIDRYIRYNIESVISEFIAEDAHQTTCLQIGVENGKIYCCGCPEMVC